MQKTKELAMRIWNAPKATMECGPNFRFVARRLVACTVIALPASLALSATPSQAVTHASITSVTMTGTVDAPVVTVEGSGFGAQPPTPSFPAGPCPDRGTGAVWKRLVRFQDYTNNWSSGYGGWHGLGDCVGIVVDSWTNNAVQFEFGSAYTGTSGSWQTAPSDAFEINILGASYASSGGQAATVICTKLSGGVSSLKLSHCTPHSASDKIARGDPMGVTWSPSGGTTTTSITTQDHLGGSCPSGTSDVWVSGTVTGGSSTYTAVGDPVVGDICINSRGNVSLTKATTFAL